MLESDLREIHETCARGRELLLKEGWTYDDVRGWVAPLKHSLITIVAAAIRLNGKIYTGKRHGFGAGFCMTNAMAAGEPHCRGCHGRDQGFMTSDGRYVDRKEALVIARAAGQLIRKTGRADELYSEDLW